MVYNPLEDSVLCFSILDRLNLWQSVRFFRGYNLHTGNKVCNAYFVLAGHTVVALKMINIFIAAYCHNRNFVLCASHNRLASAFFLGFVQDPAHHVSQV